MKKKRHRIKHDYYKKMQIFIVIVMFIYLISHIYFDDQMNYLYTKLGLFKQNVYYSYDLNNIPNYSGEKYIYLNNNIPFFTENEKNVSESYEEYAELDSLGRCGVAIANIGIDLMPIEKRGEIGQVKPSGWHTIKYDSVDGKYLYNRCHLIGYQLTGENANVNNLITCTRETNIGTMLEYENMVANYIKRTNNHVLYRVTPVFEEKNLLAKGIIMEGYSIEDEGVGIQFNIFIYNVQDGIEIDYSDGTSHLK